MKYMLLVLLVVLSLVCHAAIYLQTDKQGNETYSDTPLTNDAKTIELSPAGHYLSSTQITTNVATPPPPVTPMTTATTAAASEVQPAAANLPVRQIYTTFIIESPKDQESIQNQPIIAVTIQVTPDLQLGDKIQMYLDGKAIDNPSATNHFALQNVSRGTHQLYAELQDANGKTINQTPVITVFVHRAAIGGAAVGGVPSGM